MKGNSKAIATSILEYGQMLRRGIRGVKYTIVGTTAKFMQYFFFNFSSGRNLSL